MKNKKILLWLPVALCLVVIFFFSSQTGDESLATSGLFAFLMKFGLTATAIRKLAHFTEFAALGFFTFTAFKVNFKNKGLPAVPALVALYAVSDEIHQLFVPGRACTFIDICIDTAGGITGIALSILLLSVCFREK